MYTCLFSDFQVPLPFDTFTVGVLQEFNIAPSQLHPNTWTSMQDFRVVCPTFGMRHAASCFLHFYTSHSSDPVCWHLLVSRAGSILFKAFTASYKNFKEKFFKVFVEPAGMLHFFDAVSQPKFPLFWTRKPTKIKNWPRLVNPSAGEREIFALFDSLPRKFPA